MDELPGHVFDEFGMFGRVRTTDTRGKDQKCAAATPLEGQQHCRLKACVPEHLDQAIRRHVLVSGAEVVHGARCTSLQCFPESREPHTLTQDRSVNAGLSFEDESFTVGRQKEKPHPIQRQKAPELLGHEAQRIVERFALRDAIGQSEQGIESDRQLVERRRHLADLSAPLHRDLMAKFSARHAREAVHGLLQRPNQMMVEERDERHHDTGGNPQDQLIEQPDGGELLLHHVLKCAGQQRGRRGERAADLGDVLRAAGDVGRSVGGAQPQMQGIAEGLPHVGRALQLRAGAGVPFAYEHVVLAGQLGLESARDKGGDDLVVQRHVSLQPFAVHLTLDTATRREIGRHLQERAGVADHRRTGHAELSGQVQNLVVMSAQVQRIDAVSRTPGQRREQHAEGQRHLEPDGLRPGGHDDATTIHGIPEMRAGGTARLSPPERRGASHLRARPTPRKDGRGPATATCRAPPPVPASVRLLPTPAPP